MSKKLNKKQLSVLDDLFGSDLGENQILEKHSVSRYQLNKWQIDEAYIIEFDKRIEQLNRSSRLLIAKYSTLAAAKLIALTESENQETARKACLDIIGLLKNENQKTQSESRQAEICPQTQIEPALAEKLLKTLAEQKQ